MSVGATDYQADLTGLRPQVWRDGKPIAIKRGLGLFALLLASTCLAGPGYADSVPIPPPLSLVDGNGVDLLGGAIQKTDTMMAIGVPGLGGISLSRLTGAAGTRGSISGTVKGEGGSSYVGPTRVAVVTNLQSEEFYRPDSSVNVWVPLVPRGSTLTSPSAISGAYTYTSGDGTVFQFGGVLHGAGDYAGAGDLGRLHSITYPNGEIWTYVDRPSNVDENQQVLRSVTSNLGYQVRWLSDNPGDDAVGVNLSVDNCDPAADTCTVSQPVKDASQLGRAAAFNGNATTLTVDRPSGGAQMATWTTSSG